MRKHAKNYKHAVAITEPGKGPWYDWLESDEGKVARKPHVCLIGHGADQYLENRLWRAFTAGMQIGFNQGQLSSVPRR